MRGNGDKKLDLRRLFSGLLPLFVLGHFGHHLLTALPIPLSPLIRDEFGLNYFRTGLVISVFSLSYGIGQLPAGWLADRIGPRVLLAVGIGGVGIAGLLVGLSQTYVMLLVFLALMGVMGGGYHPSAAPMISASVAPRNRGRALGFHMIGGGFSFFLAPIIAAAIAAAWDWRGSFISLAVPVMLFGIVFYMLLGRHEVKKKAELSTTSSSQPEEAAAPRHWRRLVWFMILSAFTGAVVFSTMSYIPVFLVDHFGVSRATAVASMALVYSGGLWVGPLGGYLSDRWGTVPVILVVCFAAGPVIYLLNLAPYGLGIGVLLVTFGLINYVRMPVSESYIVSHTPERHRSTVLGLYFFGAMEGGGVLTPLLGYLIDQYGFYLSFSIAGAMMLAVTLICSIFLVGDRG